MAEIRIERDSMGEMEIPADALYGASTQRAVLNFPVSGYRFAREFIRALGLIKYAAAEANKKLGKLDAKVAEAIQEAAREVIDGKLDEHFVLDIFQTGSGTSTNMNANEVIANRATQLLGGGWHGQTAKPSARETSGATGGLPASATTAIHPNDHVNMGQSSNDVIPTAMHVAAVEALHKTLMPALQRLGNALKEKAQAFDGIVKIGRTHLQDATPIRLGQAFSGYAAQLAQAERRITQSVAALHELPIGGTAVGTGINTHPEFAWLVCEILNQETGEEFREAPNHFEAQAAKDAFVGASGVLRTVALSLIKIANDIRWLASGPRCGIGELKLPTTQPGSSIMPGKVNPVICESVLQVCCQVIGNDAAIAYAGGLLGNFELHVGMPVMAHNFLESARLLANVVDVFREKCVEGLEADREHCQELIEQSLAMCTSLAPLIGYDKAAEIAKEALETGKTVRQVAREKIAAGSLDLDEAQLNEALDPRRMTEPQG
ncbi:MAG: class II fumarate hydratase [Phycisphaerae bacterium]